MEIIFDAKMCPTESRLAFVVYMLTGEVEHWWNLSRFYTMPHDEE